VFFLVSNIQNQYYLLNTQLTEVISEKCKKRIYNKQKCRPNANIICDRLPSYTYLLTALRNLILNPDL